jgi:hypothetical protein
MYNFFPARNLYSRLYNLGNLLLDLLVGQSCSSLVTVSSLQLQNNSPANDSLFSLPNSAILSVQSPAAIPLNSIGLTDRNVRISLVVFQQLPGA